MSDKILSEEEHEIEAQKADYIKEHLMAKHKVDLHVMTQLIDSIDDYLIRFGRVSNVHDQMWDLKTQLMQNRANLVDWLNKI
jgi:hypothetical protein